MTEKELILTAILNCSRSELYLKNPSLNAKEEQKFQSLLEQRLKGEPLQYLLGFTEFMGLKLNVDKRALIPRPETEILVAETLDAIKETGLSVKKILDIGTGCGNIAIALAKFIPQADITAIDVSRPALTLARENAVLNKVEKNIEFLEMDFFNTNNHESNTNFHEFDLIISNPPYIPTGELSNLPKDVHREPKIALDGGTDGLRFYRRIAEKADELIRGSGLLALEVGDNEMVRVAELFAENEAPRAKAWGFLGEILERPNLNCALKSAVLRPRKYEFKLLRIIKDYAATERVIILIPRAYWNCAGMPFLGKERLNG